MGFTWPWAFLLLMEFSYHTVQRAGVKLALSFVCLNESADEADCPLQIYMTL